MEAPQNHRAAQLPWVVYEGETSLSPNWLKSELPVPWGSALPSDVAVSFSVRHSTHSVYYVPAQG